MNQLGDSKLYRTFDWADVFFQNRLRDKESWMTAFLTFFSQFEWRVCSQGLASSLAVAKRLFSGILQSLPCVNEDLSKHPYKRCNLLAENAVVFLDDALVRGGTFEEHLGFVFSFLYAMEQQNLHLSAPKSELMRFQCNYWGHVLSHTGVAVQPCRGITGMASPQIHHRHTYLLGLLCVPPTPYQGFWHTRSPALGLDNQNERVHLGTNEHKAFQNLRDVCCSSRVLATPRAGLPYQLLCDASGFAAGCILWQQHTLPDGSTLWRPIEFCSESFSAAEREKAAHARELLSFVGASRYFKSFLAGVPFSVITDSSALAWLKSSREQSPFQRWWAYISSFTFSIQHRPGKCIVTEHALSRRADLKYTVVASDMLSLPTPQDFGLPHPTVYGRVAVPTSRIKRLDFRARGAAMAARM